MAEEAILDSPAVETPEISTPEVSVEPASSVESTPEKVDSADSPQPGETGHLRGVELYRAVKDKLRDGKPLGPKEIKSIRNAIHIADRADKASGGDLSRFETERGAYAKLSDPELGHTPEQVVENVLAERERLAAIDRDFDEAKPEFVTELATVNPVSFQKLVPLALDQFSKMNPEGYSAIVAKAAAGYMQSEGIPTQWAILNAFLPNMPDFAGKDQVLEAIRTVYRTVSSLDTMAAQKWEPKGDQQPSGQMGDPKSEGDSLQDRELRVTLREWNPEVSRPGVEMRNQEMDRIAASQKITLTDADKKKIGAAVTEELNARLAADSRYGQAMRGYLQAGNRKGYADRALSEYKKLVPSITRRHTQVVIDEKKTQPAAKAAVNGAKVAQPLPAATKDTNGNLIKWLGGHPRTQGKEIDLARTSNSMLQRNEAYLKGEQGLFKWRKQTV